MKKKDINKFKDVEGLLALSPLSGFAMVLVGVGGCIVNPAQFAVGLGFAIVGTLTIVGGALALKKLRKEKEKRERKKREAERKAQDEKSGENYLDSLKPNYLNKNKTQPYIVEIEDEKDNVR